MIEYALRKRLVQTAAELGRDELRVLVLVAERLAAGRRRYGSLDIEGDTRNFCAEALEEAADGFAYVACALMQGRP